MTQVYFYLCQTCLGAFIYSSICKKECFLQLHKQGETEYLVMGGGGHLGSLFNLLMIGVYGALLNVDTYIHTSAFQDIHKFNLYWI